MANMDLDHHHWEPNVRMYQVTTYHHVDDYRGFLPLFESLMDYSRDFNPIELGQMVPRLREQLESLFTDSGWEGDGEIGCFLVQPFMMDGGDNFCKTGFHVKQANNGTSFIALPENFPGVLFGCSP